MEKKIIEVMNYVIYTICVAFTSFVFGTGMAGFIVKDFIPLWTAALLIVLSIAMAVEINGLVNAEGGEYESVYITMCRKIFETFEKEDF